MPEMSEIFHWSETRFKLQQWVDSSGCSEGLAAQVIAHEGFKEIEPIHPHGGRDGSKDAICKKNEKIWIMAVYFPRGEKKFTELKKKFLGDLKGVKSNNANGIVFITNQDVTDSQRKSLITKGKPYLVDLFPLVRVTHILDLPAMHGVRKQFLGISFEATESLKEQKLEPYVNHNQSSAVEKEKICNLLLADHIGNSVKDDIIQGFSLISDSFTKIFLELDSIINKEILAKNINDLLNLLSGLDEKIRNHFNAATKQKLGKDIKELSQTTERSDKKGIADYLDVKLSELSTKIDGIKILISKTQLEKQSTQFSFEKGKSDLNDVKLLHEDLIKESLRIFINYKKNEL